MIKKLFVSIKRRFLQVIGRCPYCGKKFVEGFGGGSLLFLSNMKMCPDKHYAEELHHTGATIVYDRGGEPLNVVDINQNKSEDDIDEVQ